LYSNKKNSPLFQFLYDVNEEYDEWGLEEDEWGFIS